MRINNCKHFMNVCDGDDYISVWEFWTVFDTLNSACLRYNRLAEQDYNLRATRKINSSYSAINKCQGTRCNMAFKNC